MSANPIHTWHVGKPRVCMNKHVLLETWVFYEMCNLIKLLITKINFVLSTLPCEMVKRFE